jgi:hypothetical protein
MTRQSSPPGGSRSDRLLSAYLELLAGEAPSSHLLELRFRVSDQQLANRFYPISERAHLVGDITDRAPRTDVYVGCAPRSVRRGTKDAVEQVWVLWAECDGRESANRLHAYRPKPALIVASGTGPNCHGYWPLTTPLAPADAEAANLRLAHALQADLACFDAGRILRPPTTWNFKHEPPTPVAALRFETGRRFDVEQVLADAPHVSVDVVERRWARGARDTRRDPLLAIPPSMYVADLLGRRPGRNHKVACPFHDDERPSLHVYESGARGWCCFSCRRGGTIYDLAGPLWGLQTRGRDFAALRAQLLERYARELSTARPAPGRGLGR